MLENVLRHQSIDANPPVVIPGIFVIQAQGFGAVAKHAKGRLGRFGRELRYLVLKQFKLCENARRYDVFPVA